MDEQTRIYINSAYIAKCKGNMYFYAISTNMITDAMAPNGDGISAKHKDAINYVHCLHNRPALLGHSYIVTCNSDWFKAVVLMVF